MAEEDHGSAVAEDYRQALEDLTQNLRVEIVTLTNVAKESIKYAFQIADVLREHIIKSAATKTLPALYVLDSIVKNVGTPYTIYFGQKLYNIFMGAYAKVDSQTRRKMDEMLKTWKEPVPGSLDKRPVFPPDVVRPIENALVEFRQVAYAVHQNNMQGQHQLLGRSRQPMPMRDTPTPPNGRPGSQQAGPYGQQPFAGPNGRPPPGQYPVQQPTYAEYGHNGNYPQTVAHARPGPYEDHRRPHQTLSIDLLMDDIQRLIRVEKADLARNPLDTSKQGRLKALQDLEMFIQRPDVPQEHLMLVRDRIAELSVNMRAYNAAPHAPAITQSPADIRRDLTPRPQQPVRMASPAVVGPGPSASLSIESLLGQGAQNALAALLAKAQKTATASSTPQPSTVAAVNKAPMTQQSTSGLAADPMALLAMLKKTGMIAAEATGPSTTSTTATMRTVPVGGVSPPREQRAVGVWGPDAAVMFSPAVLKQYRPAAMAKLYGDLGSQCVQCGRRFKTDEAGREKKTAHLDWHFRVNQRMVEAEKRGQHRSWYTDADDWVRSRETTDDGDGAAATARPTDGTLSAAAATSLQQARAPPKVQYIRAPDPGDTRTNKTCPVCQEEFDSEYMKDEGVDDWVWLDAVVVRNRVFHASCLAAATKDKAPEPVLGKRKVEGDFQPFRDKGQMFGS